MKYFAIFIILICSVIVTSQSFAMCVMNEDWPDAPCMDMIENGHYPQEQVDRWTEYYDYKGAEFMEVKNKR